MSAATTSPRPNAAPRRATGRRYDEVPYLSHAVSNTDPESLATMGVLFGMRPAAPERCRVLELGCATGVNLAAMAVAHPEARFLGIDASERQIEMARALAGSCGLTNLEFARCDFVDLLEDAGEFDYIVCHGVYSWVSRARQRAILEIFSRHLAPQGIAYVSYNTLPGWHVRLMAREMMLFHVRGIPDAAERIRQARALPHFLKRFETSKTGLYPKILEEFCENLSEETDDYVFHEYLEEDNEPVYFSQLVAQAAASNLQYLAPASFIAWEHNLDAELTEMLSPVSNRLVREQYLDFLSNRIFRRSLLCRSDATISQTPRREAIPQLLAIGRATPVRPEVDIASDREERFQSPPEQSLRTNRPVTKAVLVTLAERIPQAISFAALRELALPRLAGGPEAGVGADTFAAALLQCHLSSVITLTVSVPPAAAAGAERPVASPVARFQAGRSEPVVNLRHRNLDLPDLDLFLLPLLDGTRDGAALADAFVRAVAAGDLKIESEGATVADPAVAREISAEAVNRGLEHLATSCLLMP
ncbi:MAG TPA: class I SAM-dependent methyltransferase [Thermoanaerobaculia bacterium]|nr:class I SAM-dependent methyltransferase [Thermoanaerobaculia bacterium]